ncbi:Hypothetical predicted protein [Prunus dulcis]|uniref:Uncharacterized protein n=1 Tax=Prunus dulcis TaxID=3755 RepID=A0A5E4GP93_PRUDU|nr:Hypothetical predicted protein [Prunus dulcis]
MAPSPPSDSKHWSHISPVVFGASFSPFVFFIAKVFLAMVLVHSRGESHVSASSGTWTRGIPEDRFLVDGSGDWGLGFLGVTWLSCDTRSLFSMLLFSAICMAFSG